MNEQAIFLAALEIADPAERAAYLSTTCDGKSTLRRQVEALLAAHERSGEFLDVPALQQIAAGTPEDNPSHAATCAERQIAGDEINLSFLQPSTKPGSLGRLGHYEIQEVIGRGGCGIVLKAFDEMLHRIVAIKVMSPELAATSPARKRFLREARTAAAIRHENVVSIHAVDEQPVPFLVMEYVAGQTLQQKLDQSGPLDVRDIVSIGYQIACGLEAAHAIGLIHRDIKPANILLEQGKDRIKITDFGLARTADDASLTQSGTIAGTPLYMSPEQAQGRAIDQRSDLFSLGSVLYVMCSGRPPFRAATTLAVLQRVANEEPRPIQEIIPETPDWLVAIIAKLHVKQPGDRFASAQEVAARLAGHQAEMQRNGGVEKAEGLLPMPSPLAKSAAAADFAEPVICGERPADILRFGQSRKLGGIITVGTILALLAGLGLIGATGISLFRGTMKSPLVGDSAVVADGAPPQPDNNDANPNSNDYDPLARGRWIPVLRGPGAAVLRRNANVADGLVEVQAGHAYDKSVWAADVIVRAKVQKLKTQNVLLTLRDAKGLYYAAFYQFDETERFGVGRRGANFHYRVLQNFKATAGVKEGEFFELAFAAVGDLLEVYVNGKRVGQFHDRAINRSGGVAVHATKGKGVFKDVEVMILNRAEPF